MDFKAFLFVLITLVAGISCNSSHSNQQDITSNLINNPVTAQGKSNTKDLPQIKFEKEIHDFGLILQGEKVTYTFKFKNIGNSNLIIKDASATCGCTVPKFDREPIAPGKTGSIEVIFDSHNRTGRQYKTVTVWSNCQPNKNKLQIVSEIVVPK